MTVYPCLLSPVRLGALELPNRVIMGSMHTGLEETGDWQRVAAYYATRATAGLIVTGGMAPSREGAVLPGAAGLLSEDDIADHRVVTDAVHAAGGRIAAQILHAGRYAFGSDCVAPSALRSPISPFPPRELDAPGIEAQAAAIAASARRAVLAGYDAVEVWGPRAICSTSSSRPGPTGGRMAGAEAPRIGCACLSTWCGGCAPP